MSGLQLLQKLRDSGSSLPAIMITGNSDVAIAVQAMKAGASDFIEKPVCGSELVESSKRALEQSTDKIKLADRRKLATRHIAGLPALARLAHAAHPANSDLAETA